MRQPAEVVQWPGHRTTQEKLKSGSKKGNKQTKHEFKEKSSRHKISSESQEEAEKGILVQRIMVGGGDRENVAKNNKSHTLRLWKNICPSIFTF